MNNTIMIVDDMKINIEILASSLGDEYHIMPATSGEGAMKLLERKKPDLVLLDVFMPGIDGFGVLKYMKSREDLANIPVIFVTGEHDSNVEESGLALGAVDYVKKPFNANVVRVKIQNHLELKAYRDNLEFLVEERTKQLNASREAIIMGMSLMSESHDKVTGDHIERIKAFTKLLSFKMIESYPEKLSLKLAKQIILFSPLHDVGKICISDRILKKTGILTKEEFDIMKTHTIEGADLLKKTELFLGDSDDENNMRVAIEIAEFHHEKFDGTGYPHGLKGDEIPISARIVALPDVYDALRSPRPYKRPYSHAESIDIILSSQKPDGTAHFDPLILDLFMEVHESFDSVFLEISK